MVSGHGIHGIEVRMLNDAKIKAAKPREKDYRLSDSGQLYLQVSRAGGRHWRMNYTYGLNAKGKPAQKTLAFGSYPAVSLLDARKERDAAKKLLREGKDPAVEKRIAVKARSEEHANTFHLVAERWFELNSGWSMDKLREYRAAHDGKWSHRTSRFWTVRPAPWSAIHSGDVINSLERDIFPHIGDLPITAIKAPKLLSVLQKVEDRGAIETAHRLRQRCAGVFAYGIGAGLCEANPAAGLIANLKDKPKARKQPSIIDGKMSQDARIIAVRQMMIDCEAERCRATTKLALRFIALTAVRPNEVHGARWDEMHDLDGREPTWIIPAARMKGDEERKSEAGGDHVVPLSRQAVDVLRAARLVTGGMPLIFPGERNPNRPMSENTLRELLIRGGYAGRHVPHGFRAAFSTYMNERADRVWIDTGNRGASPDRAIIDLMLAHIPEGTSGSEGAYNRAAYMPRRRELAQEWADELFAGFWEPEIHLGQPIRYAATGPGRG
ncbi:tyrosine-type recombinase/integrase [Sphingobium yanoikuyae]|uniref:tyrosine-type recombinase/integrase n=1 Tax=Sphingobium yanoikuyae TaxID=13690 RepID=UPI001378C5C6|nr:integrase arm-type DNA-binding domain-containing protein [Sphingobium yanoikuyae]NBB37681.1 integrase arm-type DNA-binding domain-containing protein [Sphingobium yanoikuyae]